MESSNLLSSLLFTYNLKCDVTYVLFSLSSVLMLTFCFGHYTGGVFKLELFLPEEYPMAAPKVYSNCK